MHKHDINQTKKAQTEGNINVVTEQNNKQKIKMRVREQWRSGSGQKDGSSPLSAHYQGLDVPFVVCGDLSCAELLLPCDTTCRTNTL